MTDHHAEGARTLDPSFFVFVEELIREVQLHCKSTMHDQQLAWVQELAARSEATREAPDA